MRERGEVRGKGNRRERRDSNCCEMKGEGGEERGRERGKPDGAVPLYLHNTLCGVL